MKTIVLMLSMILFSAVAVAEHLTQAEIHILRTEGGLYADPPMQLRFEQYYANMQPILDKIEIGVSNAPDDPIWWYYRRLAFSELIGLRQSELIFLGVKRGTPDSKEDEYRKQMYVSLNKLITLDNDDAPKVEALKYARIVRLFSDEQKLIAYGRILKFPPYGENSDSRVRDYMDYAGTYIRLGRYDEAIALVESMQNDQYIEDTGEFSHAWIAKQANEARKMKEEAEREAAQGIADKIEQEDTLSKKAPEELKRPRSDQPVSGNQSSVWLFTLLSILLVGVGVYFMRRKKK